MKKIVFNGKVIAKGSLIGVGRYTYEIIKAFDDICTELDVVLLVPAGSCFSGKLKNIKVVAYGKNIRFWEQIFFLYYIKKEKALGINLDGNPPVFCPGITCKHDVQYLISPKIYIGRSKKRALVWCWNRVIDFSLRFFANVIVTVSERSKRDICKYYKIDARRVYVIGNAWQHLLNIAHDDAIFDKHCEIKRNQYFFALGAQNKNKNFDWIIENAIRYPANQYVIAGKYNQTYGKQIDYSKYNNIVFLGYISDEEVKSLMCNCKAFIFPSFYEGFGIPPMEALAVGKDAIVSNSSCLPEIYEDAVYYIDPNDPSTDLIKLMQSREITQSQKKHILDKYSWKKSAKKLKKVIYSYQKRNR